MGKKANRKSIEGEKRMEKISLFSLSFFGFTVHCLNL
jgi:hypothetical protein